MVDHRERIPAKDVKDSKNWNLPFWTEPKKVAHAKEETHEEDPEVWVEDEEELEVEPLTAEALEQIRQEAYNEGLEQGLIEGRQKGEKQGRDDGYAEGYKKGEEEGRDQGYQAGLEQGNNKAELILEEQKKSIEERCQRVLENMDASFQEFKKELDDVLPDLVEQLAKAVVAEELEQGSEHIVNLVKMAIEGLPTTSKDVTVYVSEQDLPYVEAVIESKDIKIELDQNVEPGGCRLASHQSVVDYSASTRMQQVLKQYRKQLQMGLQQSSIDHSSDSILDKDEPSANTEPSTEKHEADNNLTPNDEPQVDKEQKSDEPNNENQGNIEQQNIDKDPDNNG
ncbi:flagellar assembly protein FliH [Bermanella sp. R86510]|uniref:flagellar assembly protein FliH n=1 Tax=unclassified Bermanella TaxID=2627862 RepID=UPI0037C8E4AC